MHVPGVSNVSVDPATVHTASVVEVNTTFNPEVDVAAISNGGVPSAWLLRDAKVMDCDPGLTAKLRVTMGAGAKLLLPGWLAVMEHVPAARTVTVVPTTVQTGCVFEAKETGSPEEAVAANWNGEVPTVTSARGPNVMDYAPTIISLIHVDAKLRPPT